MREFFHGWKRKVGSVTLVLALLLVANWFRGQSANDCIRINYRKSERNFESGYFGFRYVWTNRGSESTPFEVKHWTSNSVTPTNADPLQQNSPQYRGQFCGIPFGWGESEGELTFFVFVIQYRCAIIPLTVLSTWLLLSMPRGKIAPPITEDAKP